MTLITMTHPIGCDGEEVTRQVAEGLNVEVYDDARLRKEALQMGLHVEQLKGLSERPPDWFERLWSDRPEMYLSLMQSVIYEAARLGRGIIVGHGSQVLLQDFSCAMHVLITAPEDCRIRNLARQMKISPDAAKKWIHASDKQKIGYFRYAFHKDWDDTTLYDLCVNTGKVGVERAARLVMETAHSSEIKNCSIYAVDALERLSQTRRIEATLMEMDIRHTSLSVEMPEKGVAHISGVLNSHEDKRRIPEYVGKIPGIEKVQLDVSVVPAGCD